MVAMATDRSALSIIDELRGKLPEILEKGASWLYKDLHSITQEDRKILDAAKTPKDRTGMLLHILWDKGEEACGEFLMNLKKMTPSYPELTGLSQYINDYRRKTFLDLLTQLNLKSDEKLTLSDILAIGPESLENNKPKKIEDLPWHFLRKLMALNITARNTLIENELLCVGSNEDDDLLEIFKNTVKHYSRSIHPLDVLCALLHCSDSFVQGEIVNKLSMCQFAVPLLLPADDGSQCTLMLGAMRDIVKRWKPNLLADNKGFREENVVNIPMSIFSFARLGESKLSKSKILNTVLNPVQQHNNFFIHHDMEGGNIERKISDGLVEMSWYFPCGKSDVFPDPIAVTNLRGDLETNCDQFMFLAQISSAVFIFIENISEREFRLLSSCSNPGTQYYFIVTPGSGKEIKIETLQYLRKLMPILNLYKTNIIVNAQTGNNVEFVTRIQKCISILHNNKRILLQHVGKETHGFAILADEEFLECQRAKKYARNITAEIENVEEFRKKTLILQGDLWKKLSETEKELCRMKRQGGKDTQEYLSELEQQCLSIRTTQNKQHLPGNILLFINAITHLTQKERQIFLKWVKRLLDSITRNNLLLLQEKYKKYNGRNREELKQLDQSTSHSCLGTEHFIREIGQIYEAECYVSRYNSAREEKREFMELPGIAADLLLDGFPLELIDGDASNIPIQWITDILTELDNKTGGQCKMRVISILGVQSTGKSTLLNTMFGLQFPVASGRCTRGAFMTLLKVKENLQEQLGCDFILVIDTEGLKAPELASLEDSYEHDNELATLVVGLSDITIINMAMETTTDMKDILHIVVHAFLRMREVGKKPNCQFVHHNVSDVSAHDKNMRDRKKLLDLLDKMTELAAKMEKKTSKVIFGDVMDYDFENHNWYIPALFQGVPPMASVNIGYSEHVYELKTFLFQFMKTQKSTVKALNIREFIVWMENLWKAVKHEKFIFSFKNSLVADAYNKLCSEFSQWEWQLSKKVNNVVTSIKNDIKNHSADTLDDDTYDQYTQELENILAEEFNKMVELLEHYYENKTENKLIEEYREVFVKNISVLIKSHQINALNKLEEAFNIQKGKSKIEDIQNRYQNVIEDKITELLQIKSQKGELNDEELQKKFNTMWENTLSDSHFEKIKRRNVSREMFQELRKDMTNKGSALQEKLRQINNFEKYAVMFEIQDKKYIDLSQTPKIHGVPLSDQEHYKSLEDFAHSLTEWCNKYVTEKVNSSEDYTDMYCKDLLHMINEHFNTNSEKLNFTTIFELDIKHFILAKAAQSFEKMHEKFIEENDPKTYLNKLKPLYFLMFQNIFREKDECQSRAKVFCESYLEPAIFVYIFEQLGGKIVDDILRSSDKEVFTSRTCFQFTVLQSLLKEMSFKKYLRYIHSYEQFLADWILQYISDKYQNSSTLRKFEEEILNSIEKKITVVLSDERCLQSEDIGKYLDNVYEMLKRELVINKKGLKFITFHSKAIVGEFSSYIKSLLKERKENILSNLQSIRIECILESVTLKPQEELLRKVIGCRKQCPFCKAPCEDGGINHQKHSASIHRPEGLGRLKMIKTNTLATGICTTSVASGDKFKNSDTEWKFHEYKKYKELYPDWEIKPDTSTGATDYWKFIFVMFNAEFAKEYGTEPAVLPSQWGLITKEKALYSLKKI